MATPLIHLCSRLSRPLVISIPLTCPRRSSLVEPQARDFQTQSCVIIVLVIIGTEYENDFVILEPNNR